MSVTNARLGDIASFVRGITFKPDDVVPESPETVWCMRTKNVQSDLELSDTWSIDANHVKRPDQYLQTGDILVSSANSWNLIGKCCWVPELTRKATLGGFIVALRTEDTAIDRRYLYHWFNSPRVQAIVRSFGRQTTNISNLDIKRCLDLRVPLPSNMEQRRIADLLDWVDALREKRRKSISLLDDLTQSIFLDMFGDAESNPNSLPILPFCELLIESPRNGLSPSKSGKVNASVLTLSAVTGTRFNPHAAKISTFATIRPPVRPSALTTSWFAAETGTSTSWVEDISPPNQ
ncbi:restriction endonuclease subunit S [Nocardia sp. NPDC058480]|uniref:restriction endonuclease subunit S n=1 Tax=Nocardia sp. NPDC058480 TaxID=3346522 RepID=UPI0036659D84